MLSIDFSEIAIWVSLALLLWTIWGVIWRLCLSPLAGFPGPKIAALTLWYECYYDVAKSGSYIWKIEEMHKKYGPIVRVNPYELHIKDPDFYDQIYASAPHRRDKYECFVKSPDSDNATGFTIEHALHRMRRDALGPFFSKRNVASLEDRIKAKIDLFCRRLEEYRGLEKPVNLTAASLALTMDILTEYAFAEDFGLLKQEDFNAEWSDTILSIMQALPLVRHFKWFLRLGGALPEFSARCVATDMSQLIEWKERIRQHVDEVLSYRGVYQKVNPNKRTIFEELRDTDKLPPSEKTLQRLSDECSIPLIAGSETPGKALASIYYHLLANRPKLARLRAEIETAMPDPSTIPSQAALEKLPYLTSVIHEGLRLHGGTVARSQRLAPNPLRYKQYTIPARTPLSSISAFTHYDPAVFPDPHAFQPERWLTRTRVFGSSSSAPSDASSPSPDAFNVDLKRHLVASGRGTRNCLGYNLGYAMLYLGVAGVVRRVGMRLFETGEEDVRLERDWTIPQPRIGSRGVRALVDGEVGE